MNGKQLVFSGFVFAAALMFSIPVALGQAAAEPSSEKSAKAVSVEVARDRARVMHEVYEVTLMAIHQHYFHGDRAVIPAKALEDVFAEIKERTKAEARWISVNLKPMSVTHEPKTDFEKWAAEEIGKGKSEVEKVEGGYYRRAGAISMGSECLSCHRGFSFDVSKKARFAGLIISFPVAADAANPK